MRNGLHANLQTAVQLVRELRAVQFENAACGMERHVGGIDIRIDTIGQRQPRTKAFLRLNLAHVVENQRFRRYRDEVHAFH